MTDVINKGLKEGKQASDFVAGTLPYTELNPSGNWQPYLPPGEWQRVGNLDLMTCVTFSLLNAIETQEKFLTGIQINYSDRWIAMMSDTTPDGNWVYKVADTIRKYGLVKEESWPCPPNPTWNTYYAKPTAAQMKKLTAEGQEWLKTHTFQYEWLTTSQSDILKHLKHTPLQVLVPGHAIEGFNEVGDTTQYFDSYSPFEKSTWRGNLTDVLKPLLTINKTEPMKVFDDKGTIKLQFGAPGKEIVLALGSGAQTARIFEAIKSSGEPIAVQTPAGKQFGVIEDGPIVDLD